jgi:hypothetical protein
MPPNKLANNDGKGKKNTRKYIWIFIACFLIHPRIDNTLNGKVLQIGSGRNYTRRSKDDDNKLFHVVPAKFSLYIFSDIIVQTLQTTLFRLDKLGSRWDLINHFSPDDIYHIRSNLSQGLGTKMAPLIYYALNLS